MNLPLVVGVTGASGAVYARRLLEVLITAGREVHLTISPSAALVFQQELGIELDLQHFDPAQVDWLPRGTGNIHYHHYQNYMAPIASGSFLTGGMVICPCSGGTLSAVVHAGGSNLIQRAAEVHLKERRKLILVPRETPLSLPQLNNMKLACEAGAVVLPASPGWYHGVQSLQDLIDFVVARILDQLAVPHTLMKRWGDAPASAEQKAENEQ
jgi:4-hydroxy-3-polyprenylbenzoate decarboxylase